MTAQQPPEHASEGSLKQVKNVPDLAAPLSRDPSPILQEHRGYAGETRSPSGHSSSGDLPDWLRRSG